MYSLNQHDDVFAQPARLALLEGSEDSLTLVVGFRVAGVVSQRPNIPKRVQQLLLVISRHLLQF
jgi:hypothetical protein